MRYSSGLPWRSGDYEPDSKTNKNAYELARSKQADGKVDNLAYNICQQYMRVKKRKASLIIVDGWLGEGKTTFAVHLADYIEGKEIDLQNYVAMGGKEFMRMLPEAYERKQKVLIYDEAGDYDSKGALSAFNRMLNQVFNTFRVFNVVVILVLPSFLDLDKSLWRKGVARMLIHLVPRKERGYFWAYSRNRMPWVKAKAEGYAPNTRKLVNVEHAYKTTTPNFYGEFFNVSPDRSHELDLFGVKGKTAIYAQAAIVGQGLMNYYDMGVKVGRSEEWVKKAVLRLKLRHIIKKGRRKYFDQMALEQVRGELSIE